MTQSVKVVRLPILEKNPNRIRTRLIFIYLSSSLRVIRSRLVLITSRKNQSIDHFFAGFRWCGTVDQFLLCGQWNFALSNTFSTKRRVVHVRFPPRCGAWKFARAKLQQSIQEAITTTQKPVPWPRKRPGSYQKGALTRHFPTRARS